MVRAGSSGFAKGSALSQGRQRDERGLRVVLGAGLRPLARAFRRDLAARADPFERVFLAAPNRDVQAWLEQEVSQDLGVFMNVDAGSVEAALARCAAELLDDPPPTWQPRSLTRALLHAFDRLEADAAPAWRRIARLLEPAAPTTSGREGERAPLSASSRSRRRVRLALALAEQLLAYDDSHPELLDRWEQDRAEAHEHPEAHWQAALWRSVVEHAGEQMVGGVARRRRSPVRLRRLLDEVVRSDRPLTTSLCFFGYAYLSPRERDVVRALGDRFDARCYLDTVREDADWRRDPDSLLCRWGAPARQTAEAIASGAVVERLANEPRTPAGSALRALHHALVQPRGLEASAVLDDDSVRLLAAPGARREAEVITNALWDELLDPREHTLLNDVAVLSVDYRAQIPWLEDRFAGVGGLLHSAPHGGRASRLLDVAVALLALPDTKARRDAVLAVVTHPCFRGGQGGGLDPERASMLCRDAGVYLGFDGEEAELRYTGGTPLYSWAQGLARLALGAYVSGVTTCEVAGAETLTVELPRDRTEASGFAAVVSSLLQDVRALAGASLSGERWAEVLEALVRTYLSPRTQADTTHFAALIGAIRALTQLDEVTTTTPGSGELDYVTIVELLRASLGTHGGAVGRFRTRGVAVSRLQKNRAIPFGTVCVSGLVEGKFPAREGSAPLDVRTREPTLPHSGRQLQQLAFLQAVLSAERRLLFSYQDHDVEKDATRAPSSVIAELLEAFPVAWLRDAARVSHPLFAHSDRYFAAGDEHEHEHEHDGASARALRSHDLEAALDWDALRLRRELEAHLRSEAPDAPEHILTTASLQRSLAHEGTRERAALVPPAPRTRPAMRSTTTIRRFNSWRLRDVLQDPLAASAEENLQLKGWHLDADEEALKQHEPFQSEPFAIWKLTQGVLRALFEASRAAPPGEAHVERVVREALEREERLGALPFGALCPPEALQLPRERALAVIDALASEYQAFSAKPYRGALVLGDATRRSMLTISAPPVVLRTAFGLVELTHASSMLFGSLEEPLLVSFHGRSSKPGAGKGTNDDLRLHIEVMLLAAAGLLPDGAPVTSLCIAGKEAIAPVHLRAPSTAEACAYLERLIRPLVSGLHPFHLPLGWLGLGDVRDMSDVVEDDAKLSNAYAYLLEKLASAWPDREALPERRKEPLRDLAGCRAPTKTELAALLRERFLPLFELESGERR